MSSTLATKKLNSAEILTQITGQTVLERHLTPQVMFLSVMTAVLLGVVYADGKVADQEKLAFQRVLKQFASPDSSTGKMISSMLKYVQTSKIYSNLEALKCLAETLSPSEQLVILGFGYRIATADGAVEAQEKQYLYTIANIFDVPNHHVGAMFSCLDGKQDEVSEDVIEELRRLLDPQRFQNIDASIVNAAAFLSSSFLTQPKPKGSLTKQKPSYAKLETFQGYQEQLSQICTDLIQVLKVEGDCNIFPSGLEDEVRSLAQKIKSQRFRLAIVGEFSQGKSTFLNALLGEELQPVRAIPCSGTLTVLKYGKEKRVVCHYKDGTQAVIPFDQYQQQASIPEEAALGNLELELAESNLVEIVLEHPGLELCRHHVEIVDSPGLNEHPNRTAITERLLQNTDAAIFLANASRPMTQGERELLQNLKSSLQKENPDAPTNNLFVLVNFMDLLRSHQDAAQVKTLVKNVVRNPAAPLVSNDNRVHFVSARSALEAALTQTTNEHFQPFQEFVSALETFLVEERGELTLKKGIADTQRYISRIQDSFEQTTDLLEDRLSLSTAEQRDVLEQTGKISGFDVRIQMLKVSFIEETLLEVDDSWVQFIDDINARLPIKREQWTVTSEQKEEIAKEYAKQFERDASEELDTWLKETVVQTILKPKLDKLESEIAEKVAAIQHNLLSIDKDTGTSLYEQFRLSGLRVSLQFNSLLEPDTIEDATGFCGELGLTGSGMAIGALAFTSLSLMPIILAGGAVGGIVGMLFSRDEEQMKEELKWEAFNKGIDKLNQTSDQILTKLVENIESAFDKKAQAFHKTASASISILSNLLEQQESILQETLVQKEAELALIQQKSTQLQAIETALINLTKTALN